MSATILRACTTTSGRVLPYRAVFQISNMIGDVLPDGRHKILGFVATVYPAVLPHPTDAEMADINRHVEETHRIAGEDGIWFKP